MRFYKIFFCFFLILNFTAIAQKPFVQYNLDKLVMLKGSLVKKTASKETEKEYKALLKKADKILLAENPTVINKTIDPPSKSKNDYLSISRYWWPNKEDKKGSWIRKDGETNPDTQTDAVDRNRLNKMISYVETLSLAYYFTGEEKYVKKGVSVIDTWFVDEKTKMNPHLRYAQSIPGKTKSRRSGILDGRGIPLKVLDAITLFSGSKHWLKEVELGVNKWLLEYTIWLVYSETGYKGIKQENNHGSWYNAQMAALGYYTGDINIVKKAVDRTKELIEIQLESDGSQSHELKRTRSYFYSSFNLDAITRTAIIAEKAGLPFWNFKTKEGKSIAKAIEFLIPAANGAEWKYKTTSKGLEEAYLVPILKRVSGKFNDSNFDDTYNVLIEKIKLKTSKSSKEKKIFKDIRFLNQNLY